MYNILIVDDEPFHRKNMVKIIYDMHDLGELEISQAKDGLDALEACKKFQIDIVITDIKMPRMDGLEFIMKLQDINPQCSVVILSAYGLFEYAQRAIELGAVAYLLKPFIKNDVHEVLLKVIFRIEQKRAEKHNTNSTIVKYEKIVSLYERYLLCKWLKNCISEIESIELHRSFYFPSDGRIAVLEICRYGFNNTLKRYEDNDLDEIRVNILYWIENIFSKNGNIVRFTHMDNPNSLIFVLDDSFLLSQSDGQTYNSMDCIKRLKEMVNQYNVTFVCGISGTYSNIFDNASKEYNEAISCIDSIKFYENYGEVLFYEDMKNFQYDRAQWNLRENTLVYRFGTFSTVRNYLENIICEAKLLYPQKTDTIRADIADHIMQMFAACPELNDSIKQNSTFYNLLQTISCAENLSSIREGLLLAIYEVLGEKDAISTKSKDEFSAFLKYIESHFTEAITLESISQKFFFNPNYFCTLFKKRMGVGFNQYITSLRIKNASRLLAETNEKVYIISDMSGYKDVRYFEKIFKRQYKCTPEEFRRNALFEKLNTRFIMIP